MLRSIALLSCLLFTGCNALPTISREPTLHNPFPQLSKVAVAQFFNQSNEQTVDVHQIAMAYASELQSVPGFEVLPVDVVENAMQQHQITLRGPEDARRLAQILGADALVVGVVTDFSPYYPPRCGLHVEWYAANPAFHPIPPGYGLPWGTVEEGDIPGPLVLEAEMALAKAQLKTQTPAIEQAASVPAETPRSLEIPDSEEISPSVPTAETTSFEQFVGTAMAEAASVFERSPTFQRAAESDQATPGIPADWPDPRGFVPPPPFNRSPTCWPSSAPVMRHVRTYSGNDPDFTEALAGYYEFRDDARFGGWQGFLERSGDFTRFCCRMHIWEMLSARGGAGETRVVWRWPTNR